MKRNFLRKGLSILLAAAFVITSIPATALVSKAADINDDLILYYDFVLQNSYATEIPDASNHQNVGKLERVEGAVEGSYKISDVNLYGKTVKALELPGGDDGSYLRLPNNILKGKEAVTISMWVNLSTNTLYQRIWDIGTGTTKYMYLLSDGNNTGFNGYSAAITNSGWQNEKGVSKGTNFDKNRWVLTTVVLDGSSMSLYENGAQVGETVDTGINISELAETENNFIGYGQYGDAPTKGQFAEVKMFDRALTAEEIASMYDVTDEGIVSADKDALTLGDTSAVTEDFTLPTTGVNGSTITWTSNNDAIAIENGTASVTRPDAETGNVTVTLTATIAYNGATDTKEFEVTVAAQYTDQQIVEHDAEAAKAAVGDLSALMESFNVPTAGEWGSAITWTSENSAIVIQDGVATVTRPEIGQENATGKIKATVSYGTESKTVEVDATVLAFREAVSIKGYDAIEVTTRVGVAPTMPNWVTVTYSDDTKNKLKASWPSYIDDSEFASAGSFEVEGAIVGETYPIKATVTVVDEAEAVKVAVSESFDLSDISLDAIGEDGSILTQNRERDIVYLKLLDNDRMLYNFRKTFGQDTKGAQPLGGWDEPTGLLRGHSIGHYMSALSLAYASTGDAELKAKLDEMVHELRTLQKMSKGEAKDFVTKGVLTANWSKDPNEWGEGFVSAYSPDQFALLEQYVPYGSPDSGIWAPYYTLHKLIAGFLDAYTYAGSEEGLEAATALGKWAINRLSVLPQEQLTKMWDMYIAGEFGGFNESLAKLYLYTGDEEFIKGAKLFDNTTFFDNLANNYDDIAGRHANQHIPQIIGALELYKATAKAGKPETYYYDVASNFWQMAVSRYAYSIGGVGTGEKFTEPYKQANNIVGDSNCETCAAYNMLKLTKELNNFDPDNAEYMDYYERTLYNQILASQTPNVTNNRHNGTTYMLPIGPGQRRSYGGDYDSFSCCHGTGMENHVKYQEAAYVKTDDTLYVGLYLPSTVEWTEKNLTVKQETVFPSDSSTFTVSGGGTGSFTMKLRVPYWATEGMNVKVNGAKVEVDAAVSSYATLEGIKSGDVIEVTIPWSLHLDNTPDKLGSSTVSSIMYGPLVMAAEDRNTEWSTLILSNTISDSIKISQDETNGFPVLTAKGYTFRPMFAPEFASSAYTTYFKTLLIADDGKEWFDVTVNNRTPLTGTITTSAQADMVKDGDDLVITMTPNEGYIVKKLVVNGVEVQDQVVDNTYTVKAVTGPVEITVSFRPPVVDENNLEYAASLTCNTWYDYYGSPYDIMKDWEPKSSTDNYNGRRAYRNWYSKGQWSWLQYDWDDPMTISRFEVFWGTNDKNKPSWCDVPGEIRVEYLDDAGEWQVAELTTSYEDMVKLNQYNTIKFAEKINTTAVRLYIRTKNDSENSEAGCVGILRWKAVGDVPEPVVDQTIEIAYFDFENKNEDGTFNGGDNAVGTVTGTLEPQEFEGHKGHGLSFDGSSSIKVTDKDGGSLLTGYDEIAFSFDMKPNAGWSGWPFFANIDDKAPLDGGRKEHYLGALVNGSGLLVERYLDGRGAEGCNQTVELDRGEWIHVDVIYGQDGTRVYLDYELAGETECASSLTDILGSDSTLYIGRALWNSEHYSGLLDNFGIYAKGTAKSLKVSGKTELEKMESAKFTVEASPLHVTNMDALTWSSSDESVATVNNGVVTAVAVGKATITATIGDVSDSVEITVNAIAEDSDIAPYATPEASYTSSWEKLNGINNPDFEPTSSAFGTGKGWGNWSQTAGTVLWVSYTWNETVKVAGNEVYWYDDGGDTGVPSEVTMEYLDENGNWQPMTIISDNYLNKDQYNIINVEPVATTSIRMNVTVAEGKRANGIGRWKVYGVAIEESATVDKLLLEEAIAKAEAIPAEDEAKYTKDSWEAMKKALADAKTLNEDENATQEDVDSAAKKLEDAIAGLEEYAEPDKTKLEEAVENAVPAEDKNKYTAESWAEYTKALDEAKNVLADETADQAAIDAAVKALADAQAALKTAELPYADVAEDEWYYDAVAYNYYAGTMTGLKPDRFAPAETLVRAQFAAVLHKMNGAVEVEYTDKFSDVKENDWFKDPVLWAAENAIVTGYTDSKEFGPNDVVTREQMATMMYRYAKNYKKYEVSEDGDYSSFPDAKNVQEFAQDAMKWAVKEGIITGKTINGELCLDPQGSANRAECATIIQRFMEKYEK